MKITLTPPKAYFEQAHRFMEDYDVLEAFIIDENNRNKLKNKQDRICRFCGRSSTQTTFKKEAHLFPSLMGNKNFLSDFECDECNHYFGINFENELASYLSISRTIGGVKGKNGVPSFVPADKKITAKTYHILDDDTLIISAEDGASGAIKVDSETGETRIKYMRNPFSPLRMYKAFLKIALSLLEAGEVKENYQLSIDFLMNRFPKKLVGCFMSGYTLPFTFNAPVHAYLFKKRNYNAKTHTHVMALYFQNSIFALPVPLHKNDLFFYNSGDITLNLYPPLFTQHIKSDDLLIRPFNQDFSSDKKIYGLEEELFFQMNPKDLQNTVAFDGTTGEFNKTKFNPGEIKKIIIRRNNKPVNPSALYNAINTIK